jgi:hypothetical protein
MDAKMVTFRAAVIVVGLGIVVSPVPVSVAATHVAAWNTSSKPPIIKTINSVGYVAGPGYHSAKVTFKVPKVTCPSVDAAYVPGAFVTGPDGGNSSATVVVWCRNGQLLYYAQSGINGTPAELFTVTPGDTVTASVSETVGGTLLSVTDHTSGATQTVTGPGGGVTSAWVGAAAGTDGSQIDVPAFKPDSFTNASIGGKPLNSVSPAEMETVSGAIVRVEPGAITSGNAFKMIFKHN